MSERTIITLRLAEGTGRIVRRPAAVLFLPTPDPTLAAAFGAADEGTELQALASATVAKGFAVGGFVAVSWLGTIARVMVFGDVAVETDQPSLPMLTGATSRTWVEHSLVLDGAAVVTVGADDDIADDTHLDAGAALAGGFRLRLDPTVTPRDPDLAPSPIVVSDSATGDAASALVSDPAPSEASLPVGVGDGPTAAHDLVPDDGPSAEPEPTAPVPRPAPIVDPTDPEAALHAIQAAAMDDEGRPLLANDPSVAVAASAPAAALPPPQNDPDITLAPPDVEAVRAELQDGPGSLVDAKLCPRQHANPPAVASCAVCGALLPPGAGAVVHVPQPVLGALLLDDGMRVDLDADLILGRNPGRDGEPAEADHRPVRVPGDKVSRRHLAVRRHGWDVTVVDLGSTNGSFVVPHPGGPVLALEPGRAQLVEPGATVYFGSRSFTVVGRTPEET